MDAGNCAFGLTRLGQWDESSCVSANEPACICAFVHAFICSCVRAFACACDVRACGWVLVCVRSRSRESAWCCVCACVCACVRVCGLGACMPASVCVFPSTGHVCIPSTGHTAGVTYLPRAGFARFLASSAAVCRQPKVTTNVMNTPSRRADLTACPATVTLTARPQFGSVGHCPAGPLARGRGRQLRCVASLPLGKWR